MRQPPRGEVSCLHGSVEAYWRGLLFWSANQPISLVSALLGESPSCPILQHDLTPFPVAQSPVATRSRTDQEAVRAPRIEDPLHLHVTHLSWCTEVNWGADFLRGCWANSRFSISGPQKIKTSTLLEQMVHIAARLSHNVTGKVPINVPFGNPGGDFFIRHFPLNVFF